MPGQGGAKRVRRQKKCVCEVVQVWTRGAEACVQWCGAVVVRLPVLEHSSTAAREITACQNDPNGGERRQRRHARR